MTVNTLVTTGCGLAVKRTGDVRDQGNSLVKRRRGATQAMHTNKILNRRHDAAIRWRCDGDNVVVWLRGGGEEAGLVAQ
jgi:hypothetical protein